MTGQNYAEKMKGKRGIARIIRTAGYSLDGLRSVYRHESAFRQLLWLNTILVISAFVFDFSAVTRMVLVAASFLSLIVELFNTAVEAAADHASAARHEPAERAKDAAAAQMLALALLALLWLMSLWREYGFNLF
ncbi:MULTISPECIES: diacylglycerol kinase [unclassified Neisseria]|uniref:diacylglycerol kinase n=1 Tax=unclassified Neisseria TaxID=2623750 RepID=UPI001072053D|nr:MULTISPECIES: diacylglycerol kinase [unclassified Neisseria]MBF0804982.1 diacylglycerol kinase [Neisseria sp. 19428wB4_WF04]TFU39289.1 diacylglycerol kinase [Neisseria sp. WF04]